jgi:anion-transporting  ArsA/GET3 family ATPase
MGALDDKRLVLVSGKGGVGKSTIAAALALRSARAGKRTLVCEVNAKERLSLFLEWPAVGPQVRLVEENLWAVNVSPPEALREYALMTLKFESIYKAVFENRLVRYFLKFIPSLQELVMLGKITYHLREKIGSSWRFDQIIVDAPATGHAISFFSVPRVLLDTVPQGPLYREAETMHRLLTDPAITVATLVSLPEEMPVNETIELEAALRQRIGIHTCAVILNGFVAERFTAEELSRLDSDDALSSVVRDQSQRARLAAESRARLEQSLPAPLFPVSRVFQPTFGRSTIEAVAEQLAPLSGGAR